MSFSLAIVGRPNVGKSTLFNRLVGRRLALVDDQPGVTRDLREGEGKLGDLRFTVVDTAGLENETDESLPARMRRLTERAVDEADICLFLIDARAGILPDDEVFAEILRKRAKHVILGANKSEGSAADAGVIEAYSLGLGEPIRLSAEHGEGMNELYSTLLPLSDGFEARAAEEAPEVEVTLSEEEADPGQAAADRRGGTPERGQVDAGQRDPGRGAAVDRAGSGDHARRDLGPDGLGRGADAGFRHRRDAAPGQGPGQAGETLGLGRYPRGEIRRSRRGAAGCGHSL